MARCAFFLPSLDGGGAELMTLRLAEGFAERGVETDLVLARKRGDYLDRVSDRIRIIDLKSPAPVLATKTLRLARYLRKVRPDALLSTLDIVSSATIARTLARTDTRVVITIRTNLSEQFADKPLGARARALLVRALYPHADQLTANSIGTADDVARMAGLDRDRIEVIYNPAVPLDIDELVAEPLEHPWFAQGEPPVIVSVGRLVRQKDFGTLIRALGRMRDETDARLLIIGGADPREGDVPPMLERLVSSEGLDGRVEFTGFVPNPIAYMARASAFALSSAYEGFGNVLVEALAAGTPVVSTDCPSGPREILGDGEWGKLVPVGDDEAMAAAIADVLRDPPPAGRLRERARDFTLDPAVDRFLEMARIAA